MPLRMILVGAIVLLPVGILLTLGAAALLAQLGDTDGARWLGRLAALEGVGWGSALVAAIMAQALGGLGCCEPPPRPQRES